MEATEQTVDMIGDVAEFMRAFSHHMEDAPGFPGDDVRELRLKLIAEEWLELREAEDGNDLAETADAIADMIYVLVGMAHAYGIPLAAVWREVQRANMAKLGGPVRGDGKQMKPEGWTPPDIAGVLRAHGWDGGSGDNREEGR